MVDTAGPKGLPAWQWREASVRDGKRNSAVRIIGLVAFLGLAVLALRYLTLRGQTPPDNSFAAASDLSDGTQPGDTPPRSDDTVSLADPSAAAPGWTSIIPRSLNALRGILVWVVVGAVGAFLTALFFVLRLRKLMAYVAAIKEGIKTEEAPLDGRDEFAHLARTFHEQAQTCLATEAELRVSRSQLDVRVQGRTLALQDANDKLREEILVRERVEQQLRQSALHDALTGLPNRALLRDRLDHCLNWAKRHPDYIYAVLFIDLDNFKLINDSLGHNAGDEMIVQTGQRIAGFLRSTDCVSWVSDHLTARLGGDEFVVLLDGIRAAENAELVADRLQKELSQPFLIRGHEISVGISIGIALNHSNYDRIEDLLRDADTAMYRAKVAGKGQYAVFDERMHATVRQRLQLENNLRKAIESNQLEVMYQPIIELATGRIVAFEALARWSHPEKGNIPPVDFIPVAEETGLIVPLGAWILRESCLFMQSWNRKQRVEDAIGMNVNVSKRQLQDPGFIGQIEQSLQEFALSPDKLRLEITESVVVMTPEAIGATLRRIHDLGVQLHLDDFGTGLSSLSCLKDFPLDVLKIDRTFVDGVRLGRTYIAIVGAIVTLAHNLNLRVTAEGIEDDAQLSTLTTLGCDFGQGYHFAKPLTATAAEALLRKGLPKPPQRQNVLQTAAS